jgi:hypothetical protein
LQSGELVVMITDRQRRVDRMVRGLSSASLIERGLRRFDREIGGASDEQLDAWWGDSADPPAPPLETVCILPSLFIRSLVIEFVGHDVYMALRVQGIRPWVARLDVVAGRLVRTYQEGMIDYSAANANGSRGVFLCFCLLQGVPYEVFDRARRIGPRRVFIIHDGTAWIDITQACAERCAAGIEPREQR